MKREDIRDANLLWDWFFMGFYGTCGAVVGFLFCTVVMMCVVAVKGWIQG